MYKRHIYHPSLAIVSPEHYYDRAFENYPKRWAVSVLGRLARMYAKPDVYFYGDDQNEYFKEIDKTSTILTFSHRGKKKLHDPSAAAAVVHKTPQLLNKIDDAKVWAAIPYVTHKTLGRIVCSLGAVPVIRSRDYAHYGVNEQKEMTQAVTNSLIDHSVNHLQTTGNMLAIFPAGTKGSLDIREGVGLVLEQLNNVNVMPIAMVSSSEATDNRPKDLKIMFGQQIKTEPDMQASEYVKLIANNLAIATEFIENQG